MAHDPGQCLPALGGHHDLGPECPGRLKEIPSSVGGGGQEEEKTSHECILATSRRLKSDCSRGAEWRMIAEDQASLEPILRISPTAREKLLEVRTGDPQPERLALWLEVTGVGDGEYTYNMFFQLREAVTASDTVLGDDDLAIAIPPNSVEKLRGASIDWVVEFDHAGWAITNPNRPRPTIGSPLPIMPVGPSSPAVGSRPPADLKADLSGAVAQRVMMVLDRQINPSIAAHGGHAELVAVEDNTAYLRLSGGCQGCSMATVTLGQGIEVAIKELVPEITRVLDVTDHASGTSPYFEAAKK